MIPTALLPHRVTIEAYQGNSANGPVFADPVTIRARVVGKRRAVRTREGVDVITSAVAVVRPTIEVPAESKLTHGARTFIVLDVADGEDFNGRTHNRELMLEGPQ